MANKITYWELNFQECGFKIKEVSDENNFEIFVKKNFDEDYSLSLDYDPADI